MSAFGRNNPGGTEKSLVMTLTSYWNVSKKRTVLKIELVNQYLENGALIKYFDYFDGPEQDKMAQSIKIIGVLD